MQEPLGPVNGGDPIVGSVIEELIQRQAQLKPRSIAICAPERPPLRYEQLLAQITYVKQGLVANDIIRGDCVVLVLPAGPEMATAFLGISSCAGCAPLNPAYQESEFEFYLTDLNAKALVVQSGMDSPASSVARSKGIPVIELTPLKDAEAGMFTLSTELRGKAGVVDCAQPDDVALLLHTSGTTARPKIVPLTHSNLCASATNVRAALELGEADCCLNVMPLFHIHGLVAALLASLSAGARVVCTPGFLAPRFVEWLQEFRPTWYTAVPTMHQAILARAAQHRDVIADVALRFIRSSSSALPPQVMKELETVFQAPVIEAYGMTEASHQIASNPLPPAARKPGSVGLAAGPDIAIVDEDSFFLPPGATGEVVVRGSNVTKGYGNNSSANEEAFRDGWFRTGDQGFRDEDQYLYLTGRLKEVINQGGEKIMPREIDEALLSHPSVSQALAFGTPHPTLGEVVCAAVTLREGDATSELEIREFAATQLATFKVPQRIVVLNEIPKGATGKFQRLGLAEKLGLSSLFDGQTTPADYIPPRSPLEEILVTFWAETLGVDRIGVDDNFFYLGGDSILAANLLTRVQEALQLEISLFRLFDSPTVSGMTQTIDAAIEAEIREFA